METKAEEILFLEKYYIAWLPKQQSEDAAFSINECLAHHDAFMKIISDVDVCGNFSEIVIIEMVNQRLILETITYFREVI